MLFVFSGIEHERSKHDNLTERERFDNVNGQQLPHQVNDIQANPLLSMLSNMGMNIGVNSTLPMPNPIQQPPRHSIEFQAERLDMKQMLPQGVNVLSAEELEKHLRGSEPNIEGRNKSGQNLPIKDFDGVLHGPTEFHRPHGLIHPPPGFVPPTSDVAASAAASNMLASSLFPQLGLIGMSSPSLAHGNLPVQPPMIQPGNNFAGRFPSNEVVQNNYLPLNNISNGPFIHSSPFGLGLSIGGLGHIIGNQKPLDPLQHIGNDSRIDSRIYNSPEWNNLSTQHQTLDANLGPQPKRGSPDIPNQSTFSVPLNTLFNLTPSTDTETPTTNQNGQPTISAPWPPIRD